MAFTAGINVKTRTYSGNNNQSTFDRLITVTGYDVAKGYLYGEDKAGRKYEVFVNPEEVRRSEASLAARKVDVSRINWMGHSIDEKMSKAVPVGHKVVLLRSTIVQNDKSRGISRVETHRIGGVPNQDDDKVFQGIFTMTYRMADGGERISFVQSWNPKRIDLSDDAGMLELKEKINEMASTYGKKVGEFLVRNPTYGVQFIASMKTNKEYEWAEDPSKKAIYEVVDESLPFDWIPEDVDETESEQKKTGHVITGDEFADFAQRYYEYITNEPRFADHLDDMKIEVSYYLSYPASKGDAMTLTTGDKEMDKNADKNPLYQLSHRLSYIDMEQTQEIMGKNAAVKGIILLSGNIVKKINGELQEIPSYWVNKLHANNIKGHVQSFIRTADGYKTEMNEALALIKTNKDEAKNDAHVGSEKKEEVKEQTKVTESNDFSPFDGDDFFFEEETKTEQVKQPPRFGRS